MTKEKPVLILPSDTGGSGFYRLRWPGEACMAAGKPVLVQNRMPKIVVDGQGNVQGLNLGNFECIVLQRPGSYQIPQVIDILHENGVKVVIDMDDSMSKIDPRNPVFKHYDPRINHKRNWLHVAESCKKADLVTVTSEALAEEYGSHGRVKIIRNHIPKRYLDIPRPENAVPIVTWAGWTVTHPLDLFVVGDSVAKAVSDTKAIFAAFGDLKIFNDLRIKYQPPNQHWGFVEISEYARNLVKADIGLVPLKNTSFNKSKSGLKILEYSSLGIVPVASPTPENMVLINQGMGVVAHTPDEWYKRIKELIEDREYRSEMSKKAREAASGWVIENNWNKWFEPWSE